MPPRSRKETILRLVKSLKTRVEENEKILSAIKSDSSSERQAIDKVNRLIDNYDKIIGDCEKNCHNPALVMPDVQEYLECIRKTTGLRDVSVLQADLLSVCNDPHPLMCENLLSACRESTELQKSRKEFNKAKKESQKKYDKLFEKDADAADAYHRMADLSKRLEEQEKSLHGLLIEQSKRGLKLAYCSEELRTYELIHDYEVCKVKMDKAYEDAKVLLKASAKDLESLRRCCAEIERLDEKLGNWCSKVYELISGFEEDVGNDLRNDEGDLEVDPLMLHYADCFMRVGSCYTEADRVAHKESKERLYHLMNNEIRKKGLKEVESHVSEWGSIYENLKTLEQKMICDAAEQEKKTPQSKKKVEKRKDSEKIRNINLDQMEQQKGVWKQSEGHVLPTKQTAKLLLPSAHATSLPVTSYLRTSNSIFSSAGLSATHNMRIFRLKKSK